MATFSDALVEHARRPKNFGADEGAHAVGRADYGGSPPVMTAYLRIDGQRVSRLSFEAGGCAVVVAAGSALSELVQGTTLDECLAIEPADVIAALDGVPPDKMFCVEVAVGALHSALRQAVAAGVIARCDASESWLEEGLTPGWTQS